MESFSKNWLAILLIVLVFSSIGFLFGWIIKGSQSCSCIQDQMIPFQKFSDDIEPICIPLEGDMDSIEDVEVKVFVNQKGDVLKYNTDSAQCRTIVRKIIVKD